MTRARVVALPQQAAGRLGPAQGVDVAQAAAPLLQVGLEQEGHLAGLVVAGPHPGGQVGQPALGPLLPLLEGLAGQLLGEALVAGEVAHLQQRGGGVEVVGGQRQGLPHRAHGVAELQALVPDRVPEAVGEGADVRAAAVQEQHVDVGVEAELGPPVAADGDQRHVLEADLVPHLGEQLDQPGVDEVAVGPAQVPSDQRRVCRQLGPGAVSSISGRADGDDPEARPSCAPRSASHRLRIRAARATDPRWPIGGA